RLAASLGCLGVRPPARARQPRGGAGRLLEAARLARGHERGDSMTEENEPQTLGDATAGRAPTGIVMMNLGGPRDLDEVEPFLLELFADKEIIQLPAQNVLGPFIARRRVKSVQRNYQDIGGGSPILEWTSTQGRQMCERLDRIS